MIALTAVVRIERGADTLGSAESHTRAAGLWSEQAGRVLEVSSTEAGTECRGDKNKKRVAKPNKKRRMLALGTREHHFRKGTRSYS